MTYEIDGLALSIPYPSGGPESFGFASCAAQSVYEGDLVQGVVTISDTTFECAFGSGALTAGDWWVQVRAGATEAAAQTIYTEKHRIRKSLVAALFATSPSPSPSPSPAPSTSSINGTSRVLAVEAIAEGAWVPRENTVYSISGLEYIGAPSAVAITDMPGLLPYGMVRRDHFISDVDFNAYTTATFGAGNGYPTPALTRFDLPPQSLDLFGLGVIPSNLAGDAANNVGAIQAAIDWLTSKTNGGTITGGGFTPQYSNPIIAVNAPIVLKPEVNLDLSPTVAFRATAAMAALLMSNPGAGDRLKNVRVRGGDWNANALADYTMKFAEFEYLAIDGCSIRNGKVGGVAVGGTIGGGRLSDAAYELMLTNNRIHRAGTRASADYGLRSLGSVSDSHMLNNLIIGFDYGVAGPWFISKFAENHTWAATTEGGHSVGFDLTGGKCVLLGNQVDSPSVAAYRINAQTTTMMGNAISQKRSSGVPAIKLETNADRFVCQGLVINDEVAFPMPQIDAGAKTDYTIQATTSESGQPTPDYVRGWRRDYAEGTFDVVVRDAAGNALDTTANGRWERTGQVVRVCFDTAMITSPAGVVTTDQLRIDLPFTTNEQAFGTIGATQLAYGSGRTHLQAFASSGATYATVQSYGSASGSRDILWSDVTSGTTTLRGLDLTYKVA